MAEGAQTLIQNLGEGEEDGGKELINDLFQYKPGFQRSALKGTFSH